jgi:hypothetical protein
VLRPFRGSADAASVDPVLHVIGHAKVGEEQLGIPADLRMFRRN